jgi:hypothetical protein
MCCEKCGWVPPASQVTLIVGYCAALRLEFRKRVQA